MKIYIKKIAIFKPNLENLSESPKLEFVEPLFKRRLSQISKMTIQVVHDVLDFAKDSPIVFSSFRGEISRQLKINKGLVEDFEVLPAQFSISVFNTPPAVATIALKIKSGYTVVFPSENNFSSTLISAISSILCGKNKNIIFVFADEKIPDEYSSIASETEKSETPFAFACVFSSEKTDSAIELESFDFGSPKEFMEKFE